MKPIRSAKFDEAITHIEIFNDKYILAVDALTTIRYLNIETLEILNQLKVNAIQINFANKNVAFSLDAHYVALVSSQAKESKLYNLNTKKLKAIVNRHRGGVSCIGIDPKDKYMFSCGEDGLTFGVDINSGQLAFTLPRHMDTINDIAFNKIGNLVAICSYDKSITLFNLLTMSQKDRLKAHTVPVMKVEFLSQNRLLSIDKKSSAIVWNITNSKVVARLHGICDDVVKVVISHSCDLLFLGTKLGYIMVYDLQTYDQITMKYIKFNHAVSALSFDEVNKYLLVGMDNGELLVYDIFQDQKAIYEALAYKQYALIQPLIENNPLLIYTDAYKAFETLWQKSLNVAQNFMEDGDKQKALNVFKYFVQIPSKKQLVQKFLAKYDEYDKFLLLIKNNKLSLAYSLVKANPALEDTKAYTIMELRWKKSVALAQKYLLTPNNEDKVKEIFMPYRGVSEKTAIIQDIFINAMVFNRFKKAIAQKHFKTLFEYIKKYPFLKESPEYDMLNRYSDSLYAKAQEFKESGDTHEAVKIYRALLDFDDFKEEAVENITALENKHKFFNALKESDIVEAYNILDSSLELQASDAGVKLMQLWESDYDKAREIAARADVEGVRMILGKYIQIRSKYIAIATLISWCYISQLNHALKLKVEQKTIENGIKNYILYLGLSNQIEIFFNEFIKNYPQTKLNLESQTKGSMESWRPSMIIKSILDIPLTCSIA